MTWMPPPWLVTLVYSAIFTFAAVVVPDGDRVLLGIYGGGALLGFLVAGCMYFGAIP